MIHDETSINDDVKINGENLLKSMEVENHSVFISASSCLKPALVKERKGM